MWNKFPSTHYGFKSMLLRQYSLNRHDILIYWCVCTPTTINRQTVNLPLSTVRLYTHHRQPSDCTATTVNRQTVHPPPSAVRLYTHHHHPSDCTLHRLLSDCTPITVNCLTVQPPPSTVRLYTHHRQPSDCTPTTVNRQTVLSDCDLLIYFIM